MSKVYKLKEATNTPSPDFIRGQIAGLMEAAELLGSYVTPNYHKLELVYDLLDPETGKDEPEPVKSISEQLKVSGKEGLTEIIGQTLSDFENLMMFAELQEMNWNRALREMGEDKDGSQEAGEPVESGG